MSEGPALVATSSQTVGPFLHLGLCTRETGRMTDALPAGERIRLRVAVVDGDGQPVPDALIEVCYLGVFGRVPTGEDGSGWFETVRPGTVPGAPEARHVSVCLFARGLLRQLHTRIYFAVDDAGEDAVLALVAEPRRSTLVASADQSDPGLWHFTIRLQGHDETVFFDL